VIGMAVIWVSQFGLYAEIPVRLTSGLPQLFVDDALIAYKSGVARRVHACTKLDAPVLEPQTPWENEGDDQRVYVYGTVLRDEHSGLFRLWYNRGSHVLYATSRDGLRWDRPELGLVELNGSKTNNCVLTSIHSPSVVYSPDAAPEERYVLLGCRKNPGSAYHVARSPDGLHWEFYPKNPVLTGGDTSTLMFDPDDKTYFAFHKVSAEWRGYKRRLVYLSVSRDLQTWSPPELVMAPDEMDDLAVQREGGQYGQFYNMSAFPYGGQFLGFVTHFRYTGPPARKGPEQSNSDGPIDVQLVHSRDGRAWKRCEDRSPVIPNGPHGYDAGCILGVANGVVPVGDEVWTYYTAITTTHGGFVPEKRVTIALAKWRRDGFVSLDAGEEAGIVRTVALECPRGRLTVNAVADALTVAVLDASGTEIPGYTHADCTPIHGDSVCHAIAWKNQSFLPENQILCLEFRMQRACLYSFRIDATRNLQEST